MNSLELVGEIFSILNAGSGKQPRQKLDHPVLDVIIPVYNAFDDLVKCILSVLKHTNPPYCLIIIDDESNDANVIDLMQKLSYEKNEQLIVLKNSRNQGFVATVNKGMHYSNNDVVLLNSDTIVTPGWLEKLYQCAYSNSKIATVTPLTNNGTICSAPLFNQANTIPEGYDINSFGLLIEEVSQRQYPVIPTAVGFCMFIKRTVLERIGYFDELFSPGYGEENDFCLRATDHGYIHVLDDATFVYHKGCTSFQDMRLKLQGKHHIAVCQRYPHYHDIIMSYIDRNPHQAILQRITTALEKKKRDKIKLNKVILVEPIQDYFEKYKISTKNRINVMFVLHNHLTGLAPMGGTEYHALDIIDNLKETYFAFYVLVARKDTVFLYEYGSEKVTETRFVLSHPIKEHQLTNAEYKKLLSEIMQKYEIKLVHVHHLKEHTFDIPFLAKELNIPVILNVQDYYLLCPVYSLLDHNKEYCRGALSHKRCTQCLRYHYGDNNINLGQWREHVSRMIGYYDKIIFPSYAAYEVFTGGYPESDVNKMVLLEYGVTLPYAEYYRSSNLIRYKNYFNIGFLGHMDERKGIHIISNTLAANNNQHIRWHIIGGVSPAFKAPLQNTKNVIIMGGYPRKDVIKKLRELGLDIICILSPWPETYNYTLTESWLAGIPVLVTPLGAPAERVKENGGGWVLENLDPVHIINKIQEIKSSNTLYNQVKNQIKFIKIPSAKEMAYCYAEIYQSLLNEQA